MGKRLCAAALCVCLLIAGLPHGASRVHAANVVAGRVPVLPPGGAGAGAAAANSAASFRNDFLSELDFNIGLIQAIPALNAPLLLDDRSSKKKGVIAPKELQERLRVSPPAGSAPVMGPRLLAAQVLLEAVARPSMGLAKIASKLSSGGMGKKRPGCLFKA